MKKTRLLVKISLFIYFVFAVCILSACGSEKITNVVFASDNNVITVGEFDLSEYRIKVEYKNGRTEEIVVDETMIDKDDLFKLYEVGTHDITFYYDNFYTTATFIVNLNRFGDDVKFITNGTFQGEEVFIQKYDGTAHSMQLTSNVPSDTEIIYPDGNSFTESKSTPYVVRAILTKEGYEDKIITGKMLIEVSEFPKSYLEQIVFEDLTVQYDGTEKKIEATNVTDGLGVEYKIFDSDGKKVENAVDAGEYTINAVFSLSNHNYVLTEENKVKTAKLTITKAPISISSFSAEDLTKTYDGKSVSVKTLGTIPYGVNYEVIIKNGKGDTVADPKDAGLYSVELVFSCDKNHYVLPGSVFSKITIEKKVIDLKNLNYGLEETTYNGEEKRYTLLDNGLDGLIKADFTYYKLGQEESCVPKDAGKYRVDVSFSATDGNLENYEIINIPQNPASLIINKKIIDLKDLILGDEETEYDGEEKGYTLLNGQLDGYVKADFTYYELDQEESCVPKDVGKYLVEIAFEILDEHKANCELINVPVATAVLTVKSVSE